MADDYQSESDQDSGHSGDERAEAEAEEAEDREREAKSARKQASRALELWVAIVKPGAVRDALLPVLYDANYPVEGVPLDSTGENADHEWIRKTYRDYVIQRMSSLPHPPPVHDFIVRGDFLIASLHGAARRRYATVHGMPGAKKGPRGGKPLAPSVKHMQKKFAAGKLHAGRGKAKHLLDPHSEHDRGQFTAISMKREEKAEKEARSRRRAAPKKAS